MKKQTWALPAAAAVLACATTSRNGGPYAAAASSSFCMPCQMPCVMPCEPAKAATFDPPPGTFTSPQQVTLSTRTPGAVIHYTTDGTNPTENSPVYTGAIPVDSTTTIKAMAEVTGFPSSGVSNGAYRIAPRVAVTPEKLEIAEKVQFETGRSVLLPGSATLLDAVARSLQDHPDVKHVVVEGHTDAQGGEAVNENLSQERAEAVRAYLIGKGVEPDRLEARGFGASRPIADNATAEGREMNRRVEFVVVAPPSGEGGEMGTGSGPTR
jgi:outer membrane protein OmpA-like peptidoglycan-associated protein